MVGGVLSTGVIPVIVIDESELAIRLADALLAGGVSVAEVTFRTSVAAQVIEKMSGIDGMIVGAGTVLSPAQVDHAVAAGARFIVSPGFLPSVVERALEHGVMALPGAVTPTEIMMALSMGIDTLKFFPASVYGGPAAIRALRAPFPQVQFLPTGGVTATNMSDYLRLPNVPAVGGTWMVNELLLKQRDFDQITELSRRAAVAAAAIRKGIEK
ncbi:bifunctional 4-hydroxy-2-oxoglutarate aldolase/2-dehydro-3-deoxy-phosphogluconate aldolase [Tessaracoccus sp. MC1756]|uniref:bifunctional 4-hydroxy-2-oxoglutarate aldolase/2-dehydro-3-deoxy-phosphogluconate aldolase n=1 Tax=Tessaracoccus sp. MC1756 TaxID=2760311 RepID=UPI0015FF1BD4|nr:bifunctional 4-hydroxy-2-oxoglutarate aldolase/2-dehydro-3-deoxy-phosphogluconate aldolase [Tessaracoccus sp. MC1756]MBB1510974.1 bifunctional 4-hydroxy-2-oxoglutarate aldolase/2-dehydro-3-deoxy-phosphogluconate aldolase [Tessaracoccus sp. MC1756]